MTASEILDELKGQGSASYKATMIRHGAREPFFGVKIEYLKKVQNASRTTTSWPSTCSRPGTPTPCTWQA